MAEGVFMHKVRQAGLVDRIEADSAGTGDWHVGKPPHHGTRRILAKNAIEYRHCARQIVAGDLLKFDHILTMDDDNLRIVRAMAPTCPKIEPFLAYAPGLGYTNVPDPYYTGNFDEVYTIVSAASDGLLAAVRRRHGL